MEKQGFKQTEVGLIPEDWDLVDIKSLMDSKIIISHLDGNHGALYPRSSEFTDNGVPYITANDFLTGVVNFNNVRYLPISRAEQFQKGIAKDGDILFAHNATVGPTAVLITDLDYVILSTTATYFRTDKEKLNNIFLRYFFESEYFVKQYSAVMRQSTRNQIPITQQRKFSVIIPPTLEEQKAIATALSDVDELIANLDKLITKKKAIKQGAMQQLLTPPHKGGKRLEGFSGDWEEKKLGDIAEINGAGVDKKIIAGEKSVRLFNYMDIMKRDYVYDYELNHEVTAPYSKINSCNVLKGDIFLTPSSELRTDIGVSAIAMENMIGVVYSYHVYRLRYTIVINKLFGLYLLKTKDFLDQAEKMCEGSGKRYVVSMGKFKNMTIYYPKDIEEQISISNILYDIDKEIEQLISKKAKYQSVKQGMMQELLTGKTRLV